MVQGLGLRGLLGLLGLLRRNNLWTSPQEFVKVESVTKLRHGCHDSDEVLMLE